MKYIKISIVILLVSFISIFAYKLTTNNSNNKLSLTKEQMKEMLSYTIDGNSTSSMPTKGSGYKVKSITCKSGSILSWDNDNWLLEVEKLESEDLCNIDFTTGTGSYTVTAVPSIAGSLDSTSKTTTENGQVTFYTDAIIDSVSGCTNEISDDKVIIKNVTSNTTCNINVSLTLAMQIKEKSKTNEDGVYNESGYRYEGKEPNNYIQMKKTDGTTEMWRIIGLFPDGENGEDVIRVRRHYELNNYPTSKFNLQEGVSNIFTNSYIRNTTLADYTTSAYKHTTSFKIYIGGTNTTQYTASTLYSNERTSNIIGEVALMYPSDYGYAVLASDCARTIPIDKGGYNTVSACYNNNWLFHSALSETYAQWLISPYSSNFVFNISSTGYADGYYMATERLYNPVMALKSDVKVTGSGTASDPYIMK